MTLYQRLFSYRQNEKLSPTETFLTEILGYCLEVDEKFLADFLNLIRVGVSTEKLTIKTQNSYSSFGRPDIELSSTNYRIIIECKVEATERYNQLLDYASLLVDSNKKNIRLVYLTKYLESKQIGILKNEFIQICWYDISKLINEENNIFSIEFKNHLKELHMADMKFFNTIDLATLTSISETVEKMDITLDDVKNYYKKHFGSISKKSARSTYFTSNTYTNWQTYKLNNKIKFRIEYGYYFIDGEIANIGLVIWIPTYGKTYNTNPFYKIFSKELKSWIDEWPINEYENGIEIGTYKYLSCFMTESADEVQLKKIIDFFKNECIDQLVRIKRKYPKIFSGQKSDVDDK